MKLAEQNIDDTRSDSSPIMQAVGNDAVRAWAINSRKAIIATQAMSGGQPVMVEGLPPGEVRVSQPGQR